MRISEDKIQLLREEFGSACEFIDTCFATTKNKKALAKVSEILGCEVAFIDYEVSGNGEYQWTTKYIFSLNLDKIRYFYIEKFSSSWDGDEAYWDFVEVIPEQKTITVWKTL